MTEFLPREQPASIAFEASPACCPNRRRSFELLPPLDRSDAPPPFSPFKRKPSSSTFRDDAPLLRLSPHSSTASPDPDCRSDPRVVVGYALTSKKVKSFLKPKLEVLARDKGIEFVAIDRNRPLVEQGPFDVILHKISGKDWWSQLEEFRQRYPDVIVLDPPDAIQHVRNRQSMLQDVAKLKLHCCGGHVDVPKQLVVTGDPATIPNIVAKAGLRLPLVAKPLVVDGSAQSHALYLAYDQMCLSELKPPLVLQEFVNHGGVLFKVFIVGDSIRVVRRFSLPDVDGQVGNGVISFPRVSNAAATADNADLDPEIAELPPWDLLDSLSKELRHRLGLRLFNMDIIRKAGSRNHYYVIDINYFPGFGKMPDFEYVFIDFLLKLADNSSSERLCASMPHLENSMQHMDVRNE